MTDPWTPGPWVMQRSMWGKDAPADGFGIYAEVRARQICGNNQNDRGNGKEAFMLWLEMEANARMIAEAPALVEALDEMIAQQNGPPLIDPRHESAWQRAMDNANAVLARVRGEKEQS